MPGRIEQTAERAHQLVETGEVVAARAVLREALADVEQDPALASPSLASTTMLYARVLVTLGEPGTARRWAAYAHTASRRLYGAGDERTLQAASVLAGTLYRAGAYSRSAHVYRELISRLSAVDGAQSLAAQADLATVLYSRGDCADARGLLEQTWRRYQRGYGEAEPLGLKMLAPAGDDGAQLRPAGAGAGAVHAGRGAVPPASAARQPAVRAGRHPVPDAARPPARLQRTAGPGRR